MNCSGRKLRELLFLKELKGVGPVRINKFYIPKLLKDIEYDDLISVVKENESRLDEEGIANAIDKSAALFELYINRKDMQVITILDDEYPSKLKSLGNNAPIILYSKGDITLSERKSLSVVGTRAPSGFSIQMEKQFVRETIEFSDRVIISGLAIGCDTVAHRSCIENRGLTIAILPCGFDHISPSENVGLCDEILKSGGTLITEYPPETEATQYTFVDRDTLIAAISDAVFVVECGLDSGTMHTVKAGIDLNRKIAAYNTALKDKGDYSGNNQIITEKGGFEITDSASLKAFLDNVGIVKVEKQPVQMTLFDFMGN